MTQKDYVRIATELAITEAQFMYGTKADSDRRYGFRSAVGVFVDAMKRDNPTFDSSRFYEYVATKRDAIVSERKARSQ